MSISEGIIAIIPARGGSKTLPKKNILDLLGKPLIAWTIKAALDAKCITKVIVSTDDHSIANIARNYGAEVPFIRPPELATDTADSASVVLHALSHLDNYKKVVMLQPTSPLRTASHIDEAFSLWQQSEMTNCTSVCEVSEKPWLMISRDEYGKISPLLPTQKSSIRRQDLPKSYILNGALYFLSSEQFLQDKMLVNNNTFSYVMARNQSIDIDTIEDWQIAEKMFEAINSKKNEI